MEAPLSSYADEEQAAFAHMQAQGEGASIQQHLQQAKYQGEVAALQHALQVARAELAERKAKNAETKKHAKAKLEEVVRTYAAKLNSSEAEVRAAQERARLAERAKVNSARELESNLAQTISLYSLIQQHQSTIEQQRVKCEQSDAQYAAVSSKLQSAEKELVRLRLLLEKEHDSNERHIQALKGQLSIRSEEAIQKDTRLKTLEEEYSSHREDLEAKISALEKDRSILEAVNFELRTEREKNYQLAKENEEMKATVLAKAHLEGQYEAALKQMEAQSQTISRLEDERAQWLAQRRDLDNQLGQTVAQLKQMTVERDSLEISVAAKEKQLVENSNEYQRKLQSLTEAAEAKEVALMSQLAERDASIVRAQEQIATLQTEATDLRTERKGLLDNVAALESQIRDLQREVTESAEGLAGAHARQVELQAALDASQQLAATTAASLDTEKQQHDRTRSSRAALGEKLSQLYEGSYQAQIFSKWKGQWQLNMQVRTVQGVLADMEQLRVEQGSVQQQLAQAEADKAAALAASTEALQSFEAALEAERKESADMLQRARAQWELAQERKLVQAKEEWEREQFVRAQEERDEKLARDARIAAERERIRAEVEEARRMELEAREAREATTSIARRASVQTLVNNSVEAALRGRSPPKRPAGFAHVVQRAREDAARSPSPPQKSKPTASAAAPETPEEQKPAAAPSPLPPQLSPIAPMIPAGFLFDPLGAAAAAAAAGAAGAEAALAADRRARSHSRGDHCRRHRHHHHHHHSSERDAGTRDRERERERERDFREGVRSASPLPSMPPLTQQPFQLPSSYAHLMQPMQGQQGSPVMMSPQGALVPMHMSFPSSIIVPALQQVQAASDTPVPTMQQHQQQQPQQRPQSASQGSKRAVSAKAQSRPGSAQSKTASFGGPAATPITLTRTGSRKSLAVTPSPAPAPSVPSMSASSVMSRRTSLSATYSDDPFGEAPVKSHTGTSTGTGAAAQVAPAARASVTVPPLPLHKVQGFREAAQQTTLAAGSPLDTVTPSLAASPSNDDERARLAEGLGHFLTLSPADPAYTYGAEAGATPIGSSGASAAAASSKGRKSTVKKTSEAAQAGSKPAKTGWK